MKDNKLIIPVFALAIMTILYCSAFHNEREKNKTLEKQLVELKNKLK